MCAGNRTELELLEQVERYLPSAQQARYEALIALRRTESLTLGQYNELQHLTDQIESLEVERVAALVELARLRQVSINELLSQLDIPAPTYE
jgi:hypothetical protein